MQVFDVVTSYLDNLGAPYTVIEHPPFSNTLEAAAETNVQLHEGAKSMLFKSIGTYVLAVLPASERVSYKKLKRVLNTNNLRLASPEEVTETMSCEAGTCHPFGNLLGIQTVCDESMGANSLIIFNAGLRTKSVRIAYEDYEAAANPIIADIKK